MTDITTTESKPTPTGTMDMLTDYTAMSALNNLATTMSNGLATVPKHLQASPADCLAVVMQAAQWGMNPFSVAQKTHLVNGILGYESQLVNAVISSSRAIVGRFKYDYEGQGTAELKVRVGAVLNGETDVTWGQWLALKNQTVKNSPLWKTDPAQQLAYLAVKRWARLYCPDVILGVYTKEELEEHTPEVDVTPESPELAEVLEQSKPKTTRKRAKKKEAPVVDVNPQTGEIIEQETNVEKYTADLVARLEASETLTELKAIFSEGWKNLTGNKEWQSTCKAVYEQQKERFNESD